MNQWYRRVRRTCLIVLILALVLRLSGGSQAGVSQASQLELASFLLYLQTGRVAHPQEPETLPAAPDTDPTTPEQTIPSPADDREPVTLLTFSAEQAQTLQVKYAGEYRPDLGALLASRVNLDFSGSVPRVLIVHTHATESYTQEPGWEYQSSGNYRTLDENYNMLRVGKLMADILNEHGIPTLHDTTLHDHPSYNGSYSNALETIEGYLDRYPTIEMVIDVHRDALETEEGRQLSTCTTVNGQPSAQIMLVVGTDEGGLYHPNWEDNLSWALKLQAQMDSLYPGLSRTLSVREERFNAHLTAGSILVEVGTAGDTLSDALKAAEAFALVVAETITGMGLNQTAFTADR